jgi:hypothetical protein
MCWNQSVSWITFILGTIVNLGFVSWKGNKKNWIVYAFFQCIIMVQLGEALIWRDTEGGVLAQIGTLISFLGVWLQPIIAWFILRTYGVRNEILYMMALVLVVYIAYSIPAFIQIKQNTYRPVVCEIGGSSHIELSAWNQPIMGFLYMFCCLFSILLIFPKTPYISSYLYLTLLLSYLLYRRLFASLWCWFAVLSPIVFACTESLPNLESKFRWIYNRNRNL